ncbi:MAG: nucleotidyl-transferasse [Nitrososphaeraceae archaeon]|jgi:mannose-1-phosphate guanylyltransferase|nr:nucleotidyl-transferasse [Nitrososphaeraceae archaeon]MCD6036680.1 nucleotidyl-transferasse [Nitrososphaeraceae archaeon]MDF2767286.1 nucleotidyl-transferasse [Nitrososphaeraceae archaeon]
MKAVILAGGLGTRLQPYTFFIPKPMLPIGNKPLLEHILEWLKKNNGIDQIVICVSYLHRIIEDYFEDGGRFGMKIQYAKSERPLATAGQLKSAEKLLNETFVCLYGDSIYEFNLQKMIDAHKESKALVSMALLSYKTNLKYGFIDVDGKEDRIISWREKPEVSGLINIGCYVIEPSFLNFIPNSSAFGMDDAVRKALEQQRIVKGFRIGSSGFVDIGDKKSYLEVYKKYVRKLGKI